jgi:hypothetical protein
MTLTLDRPGSSARSWDCGSMDILFGPHSQVVAPWPRAPRRKGQPAFDVTAVPALLDAPVDLVEVDPRELWANQTWVVRGHADYYLTGRWERSGETSADRHIELNRFPVVVPDHRQRLVIISGHHRAAAALIEGRPLLVRRAATDARCAITPLLWLDAAAGGSAPALDAERLRRGQRVWVRDLASASAVLELLVASSDIKHHSPTKRTP